MPAKTERKTQWHKDWQESFPIHCREVTFQHMDNTLRYADVGLGNLVVEFQHSGISYEEIANRTIFHRAAGRDVWWVFDRTGKDISELIPRDPEVYCDGHSLGSIPMSKRIISAICPADLDEREDRAYVGFPGYAGFGDMLILDYGNYCVMLTNFNRRCCERQYASVGYIIDHESIIQLALQYDDIISEIGDDAWLVTFMENHRQEAIPFVAEACLSGGIIFSHDEVSRLVDEQGTLCRACYEIIRRQLFSKCRKIK